MLEIITNKQLEFWILSVWLVSIVEIRLGKCFSILCSLPSPATLNFFFSSLGKVNIYPSKCLPVQSNKNARKRCEIHSKLTPDRSSVCIVNFEHISCFSILDFDQVFYSLNQPFTDVLQNKRELVKESSLSKVLDCWVS